MRSDQRWNTLFGLVQGVVADQLRVRPDAVPCDESILERLKADSLDVLQIVMRVEELLGVEIPDEDTGRFVTVRDATDYLYGRGATR